MPNEIAVQYLKPSELLELFKSYISQQPSSNSLVCIRGIYIAKNVNPQWTYCWDSIHDEVTQDELTLRLTQQQRANLTNGNLVEVIGTLGPDVKSNGNIQLILKVSRIDVVQEKVVDDDEIRRFELRETKVASGFKNVDNILESLLFNDKQPKIALLLASSSITLTDFEAGINAAKTALEFHEERVTFTRTQELCNKLKSLDTQEFDAIALVRGGGIDPTTDVDKTEVVETVVSLNTPFICSVGHGQENIFLRQVSDKWTATPQGLGQYFSELVESVSERKSKSRAALTEQIKKQFQKQIEDSNKKNKELLEQIGKMTKQQEEQTKANKENIDKINEQNKKNLETQQKKNDEALAKFQAQSKQQMEQSKKQNEELQKQLANLSKSQKESLDKLTEQNKQTNTLLEKERQHSVELEKQLAAKPNYTSTFIIIAIVALIIGFIIAQILK